MSTFKQITYTFEKALREVDEDLLRHCTACTVLAIPQHDRHRGCAWGYEGARCLFCGRGDHLVTPAEAERRGLVAYAGGFPVTCPVPVPRWVSAADQAHPGGSP